MKLSLDWIGDFIELPKDLSPSQIAYDLTMATVEVEDIVDFAKLLENVVVGVVQEINQHPNADKLTICKVDVGGSAPQNIVCGGSNVVAGMKVAVARIGAKVRWHGEGDLVELKPTKIRGVESHGMICASSEIGLGELFPLSEEKEILDISEFCVEPGQPLAVALKVDDVVLDIDNKSLTNRPDLWGHYGVARELAALYDLDLNPLTPFEFGDAGDLSVEIESAEACRRYSATRIENVQVETSPYQIRSRLARVGQRPINLLVDLTNYVMFALGQPNHAFDTRKVEGTIGIRFSHPNETIELLDATQLQLAGDDLLIADQNGAIALAGVMGGARSSVFPDTSNIILEFAHFEPKGIRRTANRYDLRTESSTRFEKSLDPETVGWGVAMFVDLLQQVQPDATVTASVDAYPNPMTTSAIDVSTKFLHWRLGKKIEEKKICQSLERLGFTVSSNSGRLSVTPPTWRSTGDVSLPEDLVEEIARLNGYESFEFVPPEVKLDVAVNQPRFQMERNIKCYLANNAGMMEVMNYPWVHKTYLEAAGIDLESCLTLHSPPSPEEKFVQPSLLPQIIRACVDNLRFQKEFRIFELNRVFLNEGFTPWHGSKDALPEQPKMLAGAFVGRDARDLFLDAKGTLEGLCSVLPVKALQFGQSNDAKWSPDGFQVAVNAEGKTMGSLGVLSSAAQRKAGIKHAYVALFELNLELFEIRDKAKQRFESLPEFPRVDYDLSFLFDEKTKWVDIHKCIKNAHKLIQSIEFIEEYHGKNIPQGKKSIALRATFGSPQGTLTAEQIEEVAGVMVQRLTEKLNGELRSS